MALMDYLRPQWRHSNPEHRATALRLLEDDRQEVFLLAALEDPDSALRQLAAKRLSRELFLRQALDKSTESGVQEIVRKALFRVIAEKARTAEPGIPAQDAKAWIDELKADAKMLEEVALAARSPEVRRAVLPLLVHASSLLTIALKEETPDLALEALKRLTRDSHLQSVAKSARCREARAAAKDRLKAIEDSKKPDVIAINRAKLQLLLGVGEKAEAGSAELNPAFAWDSMLEQVDEAERALRQLVESGVAVTEREAARFRDRVNAFRNRHTRHRASEAGRAERERIEAQNRAVKLEACSRMEELFAGANIVDPADVDSLSRRFSSAGPCPEDAALNERFRLARDRVVKEKLKKQREQEDAVRREAEARSREESEAAQREEARRRAEMWRAHSAKLTEWIGELEELAGSADLKHAEKRLREILARWKSLLGDAPREEAASLSLRYYAAVDQLREVLDWHRWSNLQRKQDINAQLEALAQTEDRQAMVARFKDLLAEWKTIGQVPWDSTEAVWDRYHQICDALYEKCRGYFAELDEERESHAKAKEDICAKLESILAQEDLDWRDATEAFKEAQSAWKAIGAAPREKSEALWVRFRAVCQAFYGRKDQRYQEHLKQKLELAALAESLKDSTDWKNTAAQIKDAQEKWKSIGPVPRDQAEALWQRFHDACEAFFQARKAYFDKLEQDRPLNLEKKIALCELVEKIDELPDGEAKYRRIMEAQAQWKEIGPVPREQENAIWERFRKPMDAYFQQRKEQLQAERGRREENAKIKEDLCTEAESLRDSTEWKATIDKIKTLQARWKISGPTFRELDQELWKRFRGACDLFFDRLKEYSSLRDQEREGNLRKKEDICFTVEILSGIEPVEAEEKAAREAWIESQRAAGASIPQPLSDWNKGTDRVKYFQGEWKKIGPVPREKNEAIWERFQRACDLFFEERRRSQGGPADDPQANLESKLALMRSAEELALNPGPHNEESVSRMLKQWKRIGPVPRAQSDYVWGRFSSACDAAVGREEGKFGLGG